MDTDPLTTIQENGQILQTTFHTVTEEEKYHLRKFQKQLLKRILNTRFSRGYFSCLSPSFFISVDKFENFKLFSLLFANMKELDLGLWSSLLIL